MFPSSEAFLIAEAMKSMKADTKRANDLRMSGLSLILNKAAAFSSLMGGGGGGSRRKVLRNVSLV